MARGFLSGAMMGTFVSVSVAGVASVMTSGPIAPNVTDAAPTSVSADLNESKVGVGAGVGDADLVQDGTKSTSHPAPDDVNSVAEAGSDLSQRPITGGTDGLEAPDVNTANGAVVVDGDAPVLPSPQAAAPTESENETELSISTDPSQPLAPQVPEDETVFEVTEQDPAAKESVVEAEPEKATVPAPFEVVPEEPDQPEAPTAEKETTFPPVDTAEEELRPQISRPAGSLVDRDNDPVEQAQQPADQAEVADLAPIDAFAVPFENADAKPLMSIVLIDAGADLEGAAVGLPALRSFPAPITFAVDASLPDAVARMNKYRGGGFEVLAMIDFPSGATAGDAEVTLDAVLSQMTDVVGVLEGVGNGMQESREASDQATQILLSTGHGFVTHSNGLNTVAKLAEREGVPTSTVFRDFDSADQSPTVIRRLLGQAAFRAGQEGGVIMLGRLRSDTISALLLWRLQDRAARVSMAPISAVLKQ
jgi:polysaccharide deacetylase 2 family uncharacterized protein YibQ